MIIDPDTYSEISELEYSEIEKIKDIERIVKIIMRIREMLSIKNEFFLIDEERKIKIKVYKNKKKIQCCTEDSTEGRLLITLESLLNTVERRLFNKIEKEITNKEDFLFDSFRYFLFDLKRIKICSK